MFVYFIYNTVNGKYYVGQTVSSLKRRWSNHMVYVRNGTPYPLYNAIRKYGPSAFRIWPLIECSDSKDLGAHEQILIKALRATDERVGYNLAIGGDAPMLGRKHSSEALQKMSLAHTGNQVNLGRVRTLESRQKQSASAKGNPKPEGFGARISAALKGKPKSEAHRAKLRGENNPMFGKHPVAWNKGIPWAEWAKPKETVNAGSRS